MEKNHSKEVEMLYNAMLTLETREECEKFFADLLTPREIIDIAQRLKAAIMLTNDASYIEVCTETGMSTATISRVSKALDKGPGGYEIVLSRLGEIK